ncbi:MAG: hypothetical protein WCE23_11405 [Candidatus Binatus sp.]|uniref:DUF6941 family protein n=1 Tax=Candidatus Binatus sp. TaxID=2811406 RepID=UPI003C78E437
MATPDLELEFLLVGESADNANGKLYVMGGGWNQIQSPIFPTVARCGIAVSVLARTPQPKQITIHIRYENAAKTATLEMDGALIAGPPPPGVKLPERQRAFFVVNGNFPVQTPGEYKITASLPDGQSKSVTFEALQVPMPVMPTVN